MLGLTQTLILEALGGRKFSKADLLTGYFQLLRLNILGLTSSTKKSYVEMDL